MVVYIYEYTVPIFFRWSLCLGTFFGLCRLQNFNGWLTFRFFQLHKTSSDSTLTSLHVRMPPKVNLILRSTILRTCIPNVANKNTSYFRNLHAFSYDIRSVKPPRIFHSGGATRSRPYRHCQEETLVQIDAGSAGAGLGEMLLSTA